MRRGRRRALWAVGIAFWAVVLAVVAEIAHHTADALRGVPVVRLGEIPGVEDPTFPAAVAMASGAALRPGHEVRVLTDTAVFDALLVDIAAARRSITFFTYFCEPGALGDRFARALAERARAGVRVLLLGDGFACDTLLEDVRAEVEAAGGQVAVHRPIRWWRLHRSQHRNHARLVVIDGTVGYTGGFGLADPWTGEGAEGPWRDTSVRFTGPAVADLQAAFVNAWAEATGTLLASPPLLPAPPTPDSTGAPAGPPGGVAAALVISAPALGSTAAERASALTVEGARRRLWISNSYFVPTPLFNDLLIAAARRGVDVRLLLPGTVVDHGTTRWAGRGFYDNLLAAGVRIWEYQPQMMHAKTMVVDGTWSVLGSLNLDHRSMRVNEESMLLVWDRGIGAQLEAMFEADLVRSREITPEVRRTVPLWERAREDLTRAAAPLL